MGDEQAKISVEESVSKTQEECATSSDGNGFLNLLQKAFSSKKQNCDTSVSQIFSKFTSVAGNLLGNSEKTDAGKGLVASKGAISKAADTLKTCLGKASEKASDADKANSARECREKAREMFEGTAQEENVDQSQFDAKLHRFASKEAAAYLRKCIKIQGDSEKGSCLERATREFVDLAAEENEASSRETILRNIREGALSSAVETVAVCRRKSGSSEAAKAACLTAAKEKLEEHKGVFDDG